jgi:glycosyltransferase involved in cell wall biosynthesis
VRVLYVNHVARVSGAERALLDLLAALPSSVTPLVACPPGDLAHAVHANDLAEVTPIAGTEGSLRLHPIRTPRALGELARNAAQIRRIVRQRDVDLIHANSTRAGLIALSPSVAPNRPCVVHVHDRLADDPVTRAVKRITSRRASIIVTVSHYTAEPFLAGMPPDKIEVVFNPLDISRFTPTRMSRAEARATIGGSPGPLLGVVAQVTPWKAQDDAIRALAHLRRRRPDARLLIVGEPKFTSPATRYDNLTYDRALRDLAGRLSVADAIDFLGERDDVATVIRGLDVLLVPSWHEPFGRTVIEAVALGTPVVATAVGGPAEVLRDPQDGRLLAPRQPEAWAAAVDELLDRPPRSEREEAEAHAHIAGRFDSRHYAERLVSVYERLLAAS